ncbi:MAG TPA: DUF421 domain-containing protein [Sphingobacteriaceae bacterium]|nr:DUF421 domain-containing protein [Sphingobacteriaceae bacterium]
MAEQLTTIFWRTIFFYFFLLVAVRLMGKHSLNQLSPFDFVVTIMLAETAVMAIEQPQMSVWTGVLPIALLVALEIALAYLGLKFRPVRRWVGGSPTVVIRDGRIMEKELRRLRYNLDDLLEQLRLKNAPNIADVDYAVWEASGQLSVVPKAHRRPVQPADLGVDPVRDGMPAILISDGVVDQKALQQAGLTSARLEELLEKHRVGPVEQVLLASLDRRGNLWIQSRGSDGQGKTKQKLISVAKDDDRKG